MSTEPQIGAKVTVKPKDDDDPKALEWEGCEAVVVGIVRGQVNTYVRVQDVATGHKVTLRTQDLQLQ